MICVSVTLGVDVPPRDRVEMQAAGAADNLFPIEDVRVYVNDVLQPKSHVEVSAKRDVGEGELTIVNKSRNVWVKDATLTVCWPEPGEVIPPVTPVTPVSVIVPVTGGGLAMEAGIVEAIGEILSIAAATGQQLIASAGTVIASTIRNAIADITGVGLAANPGGLAVSAGGGISVGVSGLGLTASAGTPFIWARIPSSVTLTGQTLTMTAGTTAGVPGVRSTTPVSIKKKDAMTIAAGTVSVTTTIRPTPPPPLSVIVAVAGQRLTASAGDVTVSATVGGSVNVFYPATGLPAPVTQITVSTAGYTAGTGYAVNTISPHGTNAIGAAFAHNFWTSPLTTTKYLTASDVRNFLFAGTYYSRDQSVSGYCRFGEVFLRLTGGKAWAFTFNFEGSGSLDISLCEGLSQGTSSLIRYSATATYYAFGTSTLNADIAAILPTYNPSATNAHRFKCACEGLDLVFYYSLDGVTFEVIYRLASPDYATWLHMTPGAVAIASVGGDYGWRAFTIDYDDSPVAYLSDFTSTLYVSDLGVKDVDTTGSIAAGTPTLTVADASGFNVGDHVIVGIDGAAGAGATGTKGPGGTFPALSYANAAAMTADTTKPPDILCWLIDTGFTYRFYQPTGTWAKVETNEFNDYIDKAIPLALRATITAKAGSTLTLSAAAQVAVTNSGVWHDNAPILNSLGRNEAYNVAVPALTVRYPDSRLVVGGLTDFYSQAGWSYVGAGSGIANETPTGLTEWWAPPGTPSPELKLEGSVNTRNPVVVKDMRFSGGARIATPQLAFHKMSQSQFVPEFPGGIYLQGCSNTIVENVRCDQVWQKAVTNNYCFAITVRACKAYVEDEALLHYIQWYFQSTNSEGNCLYEDCEVDGGWLIPGFEAFNDGHSAGEGTTFRRMVMRNATFANNSSENAVLIDCRVLLTENARFNEASYSKYNPVVNINTNIDPGATVSTNISRFGLLLEGYTDTAFEQQRGIIVDSNGPNVISDAMIEMLPYHASSTLNGAQGVIMSRENCVVDNCRVIGTTVASYAGNIQSQAGAVGSSIVVTNSVADDIVLLSGNVASGNVTNAAAGTDRTPGAIAFTDVTGATPGQTYTSNEITITGVNALLRDVTLTPGARFIWNGSALVRNADHWLLKLLRTGDRIKLVAEAPATVSLQLASGHVTDWVLST
jgi:hypothetical protein